jgi:phosphoribosylformylglycinamidine cyclo-ligase
MATYKNSGVNIDKGNELIKKIKDQVKTTYDSNVLNPLGGFASVFNLDLNSYKKPCLVSSTDGVGTKLKIAFMAEKHDTIGIDLVAMSVNDILVYGAKPLFFLDYIAIGELEVKVAENIIKGIVKGCKDSDCSLVGGETAEMPSFYKKGDYDCAGFVVGVADQEKLIDGSKLKKGDVVLALESSGIHSNGYSLVRKIFFEDNNFSKDHVFPELNKTLVEELLKPTKIYVKPVLDTLKKFNIKAMCHITGGGVIENLPRSINTDGLSAVIDVNKIKVNSIFKLIKKLGKVDTNEMFRVFNMGVGFILIVDKEDKSKIINNISNFGVDAYPIGEVKDHKNSKVILEGINDFKL